MSTDEFTKLITYCDKRFEAIDTKFDEIDKRFDFLDDLLQRFFAKFVPPAR